MIRFVFGALVTGFMDIMLIRAFCKDVGIPGSMRSALYILAFVCSGFGAVFISPLK